jgi:hypothetical protein
MTELRVAPTSSPVLQYDVEYPDHLSRGLIFVKWLLVFPHLLILSPLANTIWFGTSIVAWFAILFTGRYPQGLYKLALLYLSWQANAFAYYALLRDEYPPFGEGSYPLVYSLDYPEHLSRGLIFIKWLLLIPHYIVLYLLGLAAYIVTLIAWFAILITGRYPQGMFTFMVGVMRWANRVGAYFLLLTDAYPPFSLGPVASPTTGFATGTA